MSPPRIRKKDGQLVNFLGQLEAPEAPTAKEIEIPKDIPEIVERYVGLVGKIVATMDAQGEFSNKDVNAIASLGRAVAMLQAVEEAKWRHGDKPVDQMTTKQLKALAAARETALDAEFEEKEE